jgi:hypothetical protein
MATRMPGGRLRAGLAPQPARQERLTVRALSDLIAAASRFETSSLQMLHAIRNARVAEIARPLRTKIRAIRVVRGSLVSPWL